MRSSTWRYGIADWPRPPSIREFQALDSQVSRNMKRGGYSHQSEKSAAKRTIVEGKWSRYSASIPSPVALVRA